ncbi:hypothetical protein CIG19_03835 [Enterobacterales bacterium CwR94]|nr:hypothetical protein CIG19_03835 [Enterobacterales bacterium CwR94]
MDNYYLNQLIGCYFNQDYDLSGETIHEIMQCYLESESPEMANSLLVDIDKFLIQPIDIEAEFDKLYHYDFSPKLWGITAVEFLNSISLQTKQYLGVA